MNNAKVYIRFKGEGTMSARIENNAAKVEFKAGDVRLADFKKAANLSRTYSRYFEIVNPADLEKGEAEAAVKFVEDQRKEAEKREAEIKKEAEKAEKEAEKAEKEEPKADKEEEKVEGLDELAEEEKEAEAESSTPQGGKGKK